MSSPAEQLEGKQIDGEWVIGPLQPKNPLATGGNFSQSYNATKDGRVAFVKALDFKRAFASGGDMTKILQQVLELFNFEVDMLRFCEAKRMDRVVRAIGSGIIDTDGTPFGQVPYLLFEAADADMRRHLDDPVLGAGVAWKLRCMHHITTGLKQLHGADVVHQDLKPSNVLIFRATEPTRISKLADLGRASRSSGYSPFDHMDWAGDPKYAPPEVHYGFIQTDWHLRRIGYDLYMLGSIMCFLFTRTTAYSLLMKALPSQLWPGNWGDTYENVLPYLDHAFADTEAELSKQVPSSLASELITIYSQLCKPDPRKRGYPGQRINKVALERYISIFDRLSRSTELGRYQVS